MPIRHRFGRVEIDPIERQLWVDGEAVVAGARAFDLLLALLERRERTVTKAELLDLVWPGLVVEENNLQVQIGNLRKLLGHQAITTIPGRGYRFTLAGQADASPSVAQASLARELPNLGPSCLPRLPESLFGREDDLVALRQWLLEHRLVTVLGAGGIGKTSLALAEAHHQASSQTVAWIELAPLGDAGLIPGAIAQALHLPMGLGDPLDALVTSIGPVQALLVLDNAEHLLEGTARVAQALLAGAPGVQLMVTSQAPLKVEAEWLFRVGGLSVPPVGTPVEASLQYGAVALFDARARSADRHFVLDAGNVDRVIDLCRRLEGLALAIRLAAARVPLFGLEGVHARLAHQLDLLAGAQRGAPTRQQTLRATHDWSHGLLTAAEQMVFRRLGVFVGGFTLASAVAVAQDEAHDEWAVIEALSVLVERSLVIADDRLAEPRYRLLESAREYAVERLGAACEHLPQQRRHAQRLLAILELSIEDDRAGLAEVDWISRYALELDDLRAAIAWSQDKAPETAVALVGSSHSLFNELGLMNEAWKYCEHLCELVVNSSPTREGGRLLYLYSQSLQLVSADLSRNAVLRAVEAFRSVGATPELYLALALTINTTQLPRREKYEFLKEMASIERQNWSTRMLMRRRVARCMLAWADGEVEGVISEVSCAADQALASGRPRSCATLLLWLAILKTEVGAHAEAVEHCRHALLLFRARGVSNVAAGLGCLLSALLEAGHLDEARSVILETIDVSRRMSWFGFRWLPVRFGLFAALNGRFSAAAKLIGMANHVAPADETGHPWTHRHLAQVMTLISASLPPEQIQQLLSEGTSLDEAGACELVFEPSPLRGE